MRSLLICLAVVLSLCALSYAGDVAPGKACSKDDDCVDNAECMIPKPCDKGTCVCNGTHYEKDKTCEAKGAVDADCTGDEYCASGYCKAATPRKCAARVANTADCTTNDDCESRYCETTKCAAKKDLKGDCTVNEGCTTNVCTGGKCDCKAGLKLNAADCVPMLDLGEPCDTGNNKVDCGKGRIAGTWNCEASENCTCKVSADANGFCDHQIYGKACDSNEECETGICTESTCDCGADMKWDSTKSTCEKEVASGGDCNKGDMCKESDHICAKCGDQSKYTCQKDKTSGKTSGATMIAVSLTTLFTSILALVF